MFEKVQGDIFEELDLKKTGTVGLQGKALGGTEICDTDDYYEQIRKLYPEGPSQLAVRYEIIGDHYKQKHAQSNGKNVAIIVVTHEGILMQMPHQFGQ